ncbi:MAG: AAA family ATPase [Chloroflexota bacterium]
MINSIGEWMRLRRRALDLTQAALANQVGCAVVTIKKIEQESRRPSQEMAALLADALLVPQGERSHFLAVARGQAMVDQPTSGLSLPPFLQQPSRATHFQFVAREPELVRLHQHLEEAMAGTTQVVFVCGEAGRGKTSLLTAFAHQAQESLPELIVADGICSAHAGHGDPFLPFRDIFDLLTGDLEARWQANSLPTEQARRLWTFLPQVAQALLDEGPALFNILVPPTPLISRFNGYAPTQFAWLERLQAASIQKTSMQGATGAQSQQQLFEQITRVLRTLAQARPLLLLLDDLQWIDESSLALLFHLSRRLMGNRILILAAYRSNEVGDEHPLTPVIAELSRRFGEIVLDLDGVAQEQEQAFVDALIDSEPNQLTPEFRAQIFQQTAGHPLFTVELLHHLQENGSLHRNADNQWIQQKPLHFNELPARIDVVISQRIGRLEAPLQELLQVAAIEGERFTAQVLAAALQQNERWVLRQLGQIAEQHGLVREQSHTRLDKQLVSRFHFRHALFQQYLYQRVGEGERHYLHGAVAESLETLVAQHTDKFAVTLAYHFGEAGAADKSSYYHVLAGDQAQQASALEEAVTHYRAALEVSKTSDAGAKAGDGFGDGIAKEVTILSKLSACLQLLGQQPEALEILHRCYTLFGLLGEDIQAGDMLRRIARLYWELGESETSWQTYQQALDLLESLPKSVELAEVMSAIGQMHMIKSAFVEAAAWCRRAIALAEELNAPHIVAHAKISLGPILVWQQQVEQGLGLLREGIAESHKLNLAYEVCRASINLNEILINFCRYEEAQENNRSFLAYAREIHAVQFVSAALTQQIDVDWLQGEWARALRDWATLRAWQQDYPPSPIIKIWTDTLLGAIYNDMEQPQASYALLQEEAERIREINEIQNTLPHFGQMIRAAAALGTARETRDETLALIHEVISALEQGSTLYAERYESLLFAHRWLLQQASGIDSGIDSTESQKLISSIQKHLAACNDVLRTPASQAIWDEAQGDAAFYRGDFLTARHHLQIAAEQWAAASRPYDQCRTLQILGQALVALEDHHAADPILVQAASIQSEFNSRTASIVQKRSLFVPLSVKR